MMTGGFIGSLKATGVIISARVILCVYEHNQRRITKEEEEEEEEIWRERKATTVKGCSTG